MENTKYYKQRENSRDQNYIKDNAKDIFNKKQLDILLKNLASVTTSDS